MKLRIKGYIGALMMVCVCAACEDDTDKGGPDADQPKEATYLLYMVGQNDLKQYLNANISDMKIGYTRVRDKDCVKNRVKRAKIVRFTLC